MASDGQVTFGDTVVKQTARKIRQLYNDRILAGFAGSAADSFALFSRFEVEARAAPRQPRALRRRARQGLAHRPHAAPARSDAGRHGRASRRILLSGNGDLIEPDDGIIAIGSGGAVCAGGGARRWRGTPSSTRGTIAEEAMRSPRDICIYSNDKITIEEL